MEKVLFQVIRGEISFFEKSKKNKKNNPKSFQILFSRANIMIVFMKWMVDQEREREEELKQWYLPKEQYYHSMNN